MPSKDMNFHTETGRLSLDWMATLGDRAGSPVERISGTADLERWLATVAGQAVACGPSDDELRAAKSLRAALIGVMDRLYSGEVPTAQDIKVLNEFAALPPPAVQLGVSGRTLEANTDLSAQTVLGVIARDAIDLFTCSDFAKVRLCAAEGCSVYFVDHSRPGKRRWCSMSRCGNKAKKRAFTKRNSQRAQSLD
ncbi:ABATE domain-containing protein [Leisingera sp. F5]|uniref:CGNR zinc finger domain-containing protein n=1 Tax=Leisingera sp. F5 TaxID=1813816 RepID=UPI000A816850|nr:ABATE domain-containing protein [Leisingera sp. F5]